MGAHFRCNEPRTFNWRFIPIFCVTLLASVGYSVGVYFLMNWLYPSFTPSMKYTGGDVIAGIGAIALLLWSRNRIAVENTRYELAMRYMRLIKTAVGAFTGAIVQPTELANTRQLYNIAATDKDDMFRMAMIGATLLAYSQLAVVLLWQLCSPSPVYEDVKDIIDRLDSNIYAKQIHRRVQTTADSVVMVLMDVIFINVGTLQGKAVIGIRENDITVQQTLIDVRRGAEKLITNAKRKHWMLLDVTTIIFGVVYIAAVPWLLWPTESWYMMITNGVIFVLVGGYFEYALFVSDIFKSLCDVYSDDIFKELRDICETIDKYIGTPNTPYPCMDMVASNFPFIRASTSMKYN